MPVGAAAWTGGTTCRRGKPASGSTCPYQRFLSDKIRHDLALEAYTKLRGAKRITVRVTRRGQPLTLRYRIGR